MDESVPEIAYQEENNQHWNEYYEAQTASREIFED